MSIDYGEKLESEKKYILSRQSLISGIAIGANAMEAEHAESKADFIHKMKIAAKEGEESQYRLWLCQYLTNYPGFVLQQDKPEEVNKVWGKILSTPKKKSPLVIS